MRTDRVWSHVDTAFGHADKAFAEADKAFAEAGRLFRDSPSNGSERIRTGDGTVHELHFNSHSRAERLRLSKKFFKMAVAVLFNGKTKLNFRDR